MGRKPEGKAERMFKDIGKKIDELLTDLNSAKGEAKTEYADRIEELKRNAEKLKSEFHNFKDTHKDRWEEAEASLENAGKELINAFEAVFKRPKSEKEV